MGGVDKVLLPVAGRPILRWSLDALEEHPAIRRIVLVTAQDRVASYGALGWLPPKVTQIVAGGATRADSVAAGLAAVAAAPGVRADVIGVHDAARPGLSAGVMDRLLAACGGDAAAPVRSLSDSIMQTRGEGASRVTAGALRRETLGAAQTPQVFAGAHLDAMIAALRGAASDLNSPTDEVGYLEQLGVPVHLIDGDIRLRKLTEPSDLTLLEALLAPERSTQSIGLGAVAEALRSTPTLNALRIGWGDDVHPVGTSGELRLGGLSFPGSPALSGHSDGDVVLHAVADALLGAANLGDLGRLFPANEQTPRGADSGELLRGVVARAAAAGTAPRWVDLTITARSPHLADHLPKMASQVATLLGLTPSAVSVKASTGNLVGDEGAGRAVRCTVILLAEQKGG
jgi:2-C-methyl-D-erythritol 4-phosphate cytidylyltransferase/2-C-methyl-D-erythritol 2,4-cyclodiphosphate synthase